MLCTVTFYRSRREQYVAGGMAPQDAFAVVFSPYAAEEALRLHAEWVAREEWLRGGDELSLVAKYFGEPSKRTRPEQAHYRNAAHWEVAQQALRHAK